MAITRATNIAGLGTVFDALTDGGGLEITSGVSTFSDLNVTRANVTGVSTAAELNVGTAVTISAGGINNTGVTTFRGDINVGIDTFVVDYSTGRVAIGTAIPGSSLHIKGDLANNNNPKITLEETGSLKGVFFVESTRANSGNRLDIGEGTDTFISLISDNWGGGTTDRGRVGIATTAPTKAELEIMQTGTRAIGLGIRGRGSDDIGSLYFYSHDAGTVQGYIQGRSTDLRIDSEGNVPLLLQTGGTEKVRIDSDGRMGIGVAPANFGSNRIALEIHSASSTYSHLALTNSSTGSNGASNGFNIIQAETNTILKLRESGSYIAFENGDTESMRLYGTGKLTRFGTGSLGNVQVSYNSGAGIGTIGVFKDGTDQTSLEFKFQESGGTPAVPVVMTSSGLGIAKGSSSTTIDYGLTIAQGSGDLNKLGWVDGGGAKRGAIYVEPSDDSLRFVAGTSETEGFRITSAGKPFLIGDVAVTAGSSMTASSSNSEFSIYSGGTFRGGQITFVAGQKAEAGLIFRSGSTGSHNEWSRLNGSGDWMWGKTTLSVGTEGMEWRGSQDSYWVNVVPNNYVMDINRTGSDGGMIVFRQANNPEGSISVSGSTVSYNGGHLSRFAQLPGGGRQEILRGTILSNLDELSEWKVIHSQNESIKQIEVETYVVGVGTTVGFGTTAVYTDARIPYNGISDVGVTTTMQFDGKEYTGVVAMDLNEQLNRVKVSDIEGDPNVAGVFQEWDDDDGVHTTDLLCVMTGDFPVRIGAGVTVTRGDLLMSAGDGTAKPQGDDIIRGKTIAKVISNVQTITYDDGTFCVPCVVMAC
tara:strand:- start:521 stop:2959 length:2439 start_codon:yes stop_codon:yes gene_type:complete